MPGNDHGLLEILQALEDGVYLVDREGKITFWNRAAEQLTGFRPEQVLGRGCSEDLLCHVSPEGVSLCADRCPLRVALGGEEGSEREVWLRHARGHRVPVTVRVLPLRDDRGEVSGAAQVFRARTTGTDALKRLQELEALAYLDGLTGLGNRRYAELALASRLAELDRYGWPFGLLFIDLDRFKELNDRFGHEVGDRILRLVAVSLENSLRPFDFAGRWGGEEMLALVANVDEERLRAVAERFRGMVAESALPHPSGVVRVTVSVGATVARSGDSLKTVVARADRLMYSAKALGRDRVVVG